MSPLPVFKPLEADFTHSSPDVVKAYKICYLTDRSLDSNQGWLRIRDIVGMKLVNIRILGYLLSQSRFLSDAAIAKVARGIITACRKDPEGTDELETYVEELDKLGEFYKDNLLSPFCKVKRETPEASESEFESESESESRSSSSGISSPSSAVPYDPFGPSFELSKEEVDRILLKTPKDYFAAKKLITEDHRCIATRILDLPFAEGLHSLTGEVYVHGVSYLRLCHIFEPELPLTNVDTTGGRMMGEHNRSLRAQRDVLKSLGYIDLVNRLEASDGVYSLENVMMVAPELRSRLDILALWFEPVEDVPNRYRLGSIWKPPYGLTAGQKFTFRSKDPRLALPNREYLAVHAACCRVANLSGAFFLLQDTEEDMDSDLDPIPEAPSL